MIYGCDGSLNLSHLSCHSITKHVAHSTSTIAALWRGVLVGQPTRDAVPGFAESDFRLIFCSRAIAPTSRTIAPAPYSSNILKRQRTGAKIPPSLRLLSLLLSPIRHLTPGACQDTSRTTHSDFFLIDSISMKYWWRQSRNNGNGVRVTKLIYDSCGIFKTNGQYDPSTPTKA